MADLVVSGFSFSGSSVDMRTISWANLLDSFFECFMYGVWQIFYKAGQSSTN